MFHTRHPSARLFLVICALGVGCDNLEMDKRGSWEHYSAGGMLQIGTPTMTESGELFFVCGATGHGDIYAVDTANSSLRRITYSDDFEGSPVVVPDGSFLFFSRERDGKAVVYSLDLRSNTEVRITDGNAMEAPVAVLQNASFLLITTKQSSFGGHGEILSYGLASLGTPSTTVRRIGEFAVADSSGSHLIVLKEDGIWSLSGRAFENASKISIPFDAIPLAVSSDGGHVVVTKQAPAGEWKFDSELYLVEIESATITKIGNT
jgi:hypothetical protein